MKEKQFKSMGVNALLNALKTGLSIVFPLITYPYAFRILGAEGIGKVDYANSIVSYASMIAALGISTYAVREASKYRNERKTLQAFSNQIFSLNIVSTIVSYAILFACIIIFEGLRPDKCLICLLSLSIALTTLGVDWINTIFEDYLYITVRSIVTHLLSLLLLFMFVKDVNDYYWYAGLTVFTNSVVCISNWFYCRKYVHLKLVRNIEIHKHIKPVLTLFINAVATKIYMSADTTMLGAMLGDYYVGLYSMAVKIYNVVKHMLAALYSVSIARMSLLIASCDLKGVKKLYTSILVCITLVLVPASVGLIVTSREIILFMGGEEYIDAVLTLQILSIALIGAIYGGAVTYCLNIPLNREKTNMIATSISAAINILLNILLIPRYQQNGAAITTAISEFFVLFYCVFRHRDFTEYVDIKLLMKNFLQAGIGAVLIVLISRFFRATFDNSIMILLGIIITSIFAYCAELLAFRNDFMCSAIKKVMHR